MFIKVEPTDLFMYRVTLIYDLENPGSEDQRVRDYLAEHGLAPKHQGLGEHEGRPLTGLRPAYSTSRPSLRCCLVQSPLLGKGIGVERAMGIEPT